MASAEELQEELIRQSTRRLEAEHERAMFEEQWRATNRELIAERKRRAAMELSMADLEKRKEEIAAKEREMEQKVDSMELELAELSSNLLDQANQQVSDANRRAAATLKLVTERDLLIESQAAQLQALKEMLNKTREETTLSRSGSRISKGTFGTHMSSRHGRSASRVEHSAVNTTSRTTGTTTAPASETASIASTETSEAISTGASSTSSSTQASGAGGNSSGSNEAGNNEAGNSTNGNKTSGGADGNPARSKAIAGGVFADADELSRELILDLDSYSSPLRPLMRTDIREFEEFLEVWGVEKTSHHPRFGKLENPPWRRPRFVQRVIQEDIENTLRIDQSPHLSWLQTRTFLNGVLDQTLVLQPCSQKEYPWRLRPSHPCLLCGENRSAEKYARIYSAIPSPKADPIVLDLACVAKVQLSCEFVGFLRYISELPKSDRKTQTKAWYQCNTLREQLFWARIGAMFPDLSEETWEALHYARYNDFDFDTVGQAMQPPQSPQHVYPPNKPITARPTPSGPAPTNPTPTNPGTQKVDKPNSGSETAVHKSENPQNVQNSGSPEAQSGSEIERFKTPDTDPESKADAQS